MNIEYKDFIGIFSDVYPEGFCEHLISEFERHKKLGAGSNRQESEKALTHLKNDYQICANAKNILFEPFNDAKSIDMFFKGLQDCFNVYGEKYSTLKNIKIN